MSRTSAPDGRPVRADIQALRAIAVTGVVLYHAGVGWLPGGFVGVDVFFVVSGYLITGLLWRELDGTGRLSLSRFYARRARRILPAAAVVLAGTLVASLAVLSPLQARSAAGDVLAAGVFAANYRFAAAGSDYLNSTAPPSPLQHFWSLGVEEQFYLLWPALLIVVVLALRGRRPKVRANAVLGVLGVLAVVSFLVSWRWSMSSPPWAFFSMPSRMWQLAAGALLAVAQQRWTGSRVALSRVLTVGGVVVVLAAMLLIDPHQPYPGTIGVVPVAGTLAVLAGRAGAVERWPTTWLRFGPVQRLGDLSYSWYLWHWPLLILVPAAVGHVLTGVQTAAVVAASLVLAAVTWRWVENPIRFSVRLRAAPIRSLGFAGGLTALVVTFAGTATALEQAPGYGGAAVSAPVLPADASAPAASTAPIGAPPGSGAPPSTAAPGAGIAGSRQATAAARSALPHGSAAVDAAVAAAVRAGNKIVNVPANVTPRLNYAHGDKAAPFNDGCHLAFIDTALRTCAYAYTRSRTTVLLFGDSHATQWFPAMDQIATNEHWRLESFTKSTCPPNELTIFSPYLGRTYTECDRWRANVLAKIRQQRPAVVVLGVARHYDASYRFTVYGKKWLTSLAATVRTIEADGSAVLVLGPAPKPTQDIPDCLSAHLHKVTACATPAGVGLHPAGIAAERQAVTAAGGTYVDVTPWFCANARCPAMVGNMLIYRDDNHLSTAYSRWLAPALQPWLLTTRGRHP